MKIPLFGGHEDEAHKKHINSKAGDSWLPTKCSSIPDHWASALAEKLLLRKEMYSKIPIIVSWFSGNWFKKCLK